MHKHRRMNRDDGAETIFVPTHGKRPYEIRLTERIGHFGIFPAIVRKKRGDGTMEHFNVTHIPTGRRVILVKTLRNARAFIKAIQPAGDWSQHNIPNADWTAMRDAVRAYKVAHPNQLTDHALIKRFPTRVDSDERT